MRRNNTGDDKTSLSLKEAAEILGVSSGTINNWERQKLVQRLESGQYKKSDILTLDADIKSGKQKRLQHRANRNALAKRRAPREYAADNDCTRTMQEYVTMVLEKKIPVRQAVGLWVLAGFMEAGHISMTEFPAYTAANPAVKSIVDDFFKEDVLAGSFKPLWKFLTTSSVSLDGDTAGFLLQCLRRESVKAGQGAYFTPAGIASNAVEIACRGSGTFLDPCCGSGQFLLQAVKQGVPPGSIYGVDIDPEAVMIARANLLTAGVDTHEINIVCADGLDETTYNTYFGDTLRFSGIATNPPWGARLSGAGKKRFVTQYGLPAACGESFVMFLLLARAFLASGGRLSYVLPESFLYVKRFEHVRRELLSSLRLESIRYWGQAFSGVSSHAVTVCFENNYVESGKVSVSLKDDEYTTPVSRFTQNPGATVNIHAGPVDQGIIDAYVHSSTSREMETWKWALGLVTGNNRKYVLDHPAAGREKVVAGGDILPFRIKEASRYIHYNSDVFQQSADENYYRHKPKLLYRFISKVPVFALDTDGLLSLNSANILIAEGPFWTMEALEVLFNSRLYRFCFCKLFNSLKILRGDIEELGLPDWEKASIAKLAELGTALKRHRVNMKEIDRWIYCMAGLSISEQEHITRWNKEKVSALYHPD